MEVRETENRWEEKAVSSLLLLAITPVSAAQVSLLMVLVNCAWDA